MRIHILHILWLVFFFNMLCSFVYCRILNDINSVSGYTKESPSPHDLGGAGHNQVSGSETRVMGGLTRRWGTRGLLGMSPVSGVFVHLEILGLNSVKLA